MNIDQKKEALVLTQEIIERWYKCDASLVWDHLDEDVVWIGSTDRQFFVGRKAVEEALNYVKDKILPCTLSNQNYLIGSAGTDTCLCIGRYIATLSTDELFLSEPQRVTFVWKISHGKLVITHIHLSNVAAVVAPDEEFPIKASRHNYQYLKKKLAEQDAIVKVNTTDYAFRLISRSSIIYLESDNANMIIHCADGEEYTVHTRLSDFQEKNCPDFIRIHRSYAVNPYRIKTMKNREMYMDNGKTLPVSRNSSAQILQRLEELFG